jgi:hypothetical protein
VSRGRDDVGVVREERLTVSAGDISNRRQFVLKRQVFADISSTQETEAMAGTTFCARDRKASEIKRHKDVKDKT